MLNSELIESVFILSMLYSYKFIQLMGPSTATVS